jgi:hypothetical protein
MSEALNALPGGEYTLTEHEENVRRLKSGEITSEEWKAAYERLKASKRFILAELGRKTMKELAPRGAGRDNKAMVISRIWGQMLQRYALGQTISYSPFPDPERAFQDAVDKAVARVTDETLRKYTEEARRAVDAFKKALENPETLEEFETFVRLKGVERLTPEKAALYEELKARDQVETRNRYGGPKKVVEEFSQEVHLAGPASGYHSKKNIPLWIVKIDREKHPEKLPRALFTELSRKASMFDGWWSSYVPEQAGFQFKTEEAARQFMALAGGRVDRANILTAREERKTEAAVETLRTKAETLAGGAEEDLARDRKTNTARRAEMAAAIEARARGEIATAEMLDQVADGIEKGTVMFLKTLRHYADLETLLRLLRDSQRNRAKAEGRDRHQAEDAAPALEDTLYAEMPWPSLCVETLMGVAQPLKARRGCLLASRRIIRLCNGDSRSRGRGQVDFVGWRMVDLLEELRQKTRGAGLPRGWTDSIAYELADIQRLRRMKIETVEQLRCALRELQAVYVGAEPEDPIRRLERDLIGRRIPGYHNTPPEGVRIVVEKLDLFEGAEVLEPSAGKGSLADGIREACPSAAVTCVEPVGALRQILRLKGHELMDAGDFLEVDWLAGFDRVAMNPPFEHGQDIEHVRHAFRMLKPGGRLVAIMSEGTFFRTDGKASEFRDWFDEVGGEAEELPDGLFLESDRPTGVRTRIVVINKPPEARDGVVAAAREVNLAAVTAAGR